MDQSIYSEEWRKWCIPGVHKWLPVTPSVCHWANTATNKTYLEIRAIAATAEKVLTSNKITHPIPILTDVKLVLEALSSKLPQLKDVLPKLCQQNRVELQCIPSHCGITGNERADKLTKESFTIQQPDVHVTYYQKKTMTKIQRMPHQCLQDKYNLLYKRKPSFSGSEWCTIDYAAFCSQS